MQWKELPIEVYFEKGEISWQNVYYYFNKWSKDGSFQRIWLNLLSKKKRKLDMSCVQLDGSPKTGNHNDLYEIEEVLKEILALLEEAGIEHKGLFLNADAGFDSKSLREFLESKEIIANIKPNPRNGEQPDYYKHEKYITLHSITNCYPNLCARSAT